jgi:hypothetical protein
MTPTAFSKPGRCATRRLAAALLAAFALPVVACDLDGLSHGYGPMSALFAGAHRYQSLNGLEEEELPENVPPEPAADAAPADAPSAAGAIASASRPEAAPSAPRRSFVAWAKAKPKTPGTAEAPASWVPRDVPRSADPSRAAPEAAHPDGGEQDQGRPRGGPLP